MSAHFTPGCEPTSPADVILDELSRMIMESDIDFKTFDMEQVIDSTLGSDWNGEKDTLRHKSFVKIFGSLFFKQIQACVDDTVMFPLSDLAGHVDDDVEPTGIGPLFYDMIVTREHIDEATDLMIQARAIGLALGYRKEKQLVSTLLDVPLAGDGPIEVLLHMPRRTKQIDLVTPYPLDATYEDKNFNCIACPSLALALKRAERPDTTWFAGDMTRALTYVETQPLRMECVPNDDPNVVCHFRINMYGKVKPVDLTQVFCHSGTKVLN